MSKYAIILPIVFISLIYGTSSLVVGLPILIIPIAFAIFWLFIAYIVKIKTIQYNT